MECYFCLQNSPNEVAQIVPSSSDEELNISINTDDEEESEEQIIERRRKQREQLMKVNIIQSIITIPLNPEVQ